MSAAPTVTPRQRAHAHPTGPLHHSGGVGKALSLAPRRWLKQGALRSYTGSGHDSLLLQARLSRGLAHISSTCAVHCHACADRRLVVTRSALAPPARIPQRWLSLSQEAGCPTAVGHTMRRRPVDANPLRNILSLPRGEGRLSGSSPVFRSRHIDGGKGSRRHRGGTSPSAATAAARPFGESPIVTSSSKPPSPNVRSSHRQSVWRLVGSSLRERGGVRRCRRRW